MTRVRLDIITIVLDWSDLVREQGQEKDEKHPNIDELKAAIKATWSSITSQQCHRLIASRSRCIDAVIFIRNSQGLRDIGCIIE